MASSTELGSAIAQIEGALEADKERPWCVHRLCEEILRPSQDGSSRTDLLTLARDAADELIRRGTVQAERVSAVAIGAHCDDLLLWSKASKARQLADFGPEYEVPVILRRLISHIQCRGL